MVEPNISSQPVPSIEVFFSEKGQPYLSMAGSSQMLKTSSGIFGKNSRGFIKNLNSLFMTPAAS